MEEMKQDQKTIGPLPGCQLEEALALVWDVFSTFESEELSQEALDEFWSRIDYEYMLQRAGDGDYLVGVCAMRGLDHILLLYVDGASHRQGVASNLLKHAIIDCRSIDPSIRRITVNATPYSRGFFLKQGFRATAAERQEDGLTVIPMALEALD